MIFVNMLGMKGHTRRACVYLLVGEVEGVGIENPDRRELLNYRL